MNTESVFERGLPANIDAERLTLGAVLVDGDQFAQVSEVIEAESFSLRKHRLIWEAMINIHESGRAIDRITIANELHAAGKLEAAEGLSYLSSLDEGLPHAANVGSYAAIVHRKAILRRTILACQAAIERCMQGDDAPGVLEYATKTLTQLQEQVSPVADMESPQQIIERIGMENFFVPAKQYAGVRSVMLPWGNVREVIPALRPGQLIIIAARPGIGKSAAAGQIAYCSAMDGVTTAVFSLEMESSQILHRVVCSAAEVNGHRLSAGWEPTREERHRLMEATEGMPPNLYFDQRMNTTITGIAAALRRLKARSALGLVVIDYLQLLESGRKRDNRVQEVTEITRNLKKLARAFDVPVIALSQLSRANAAENRRPTLTDLRESGCLAGETLVTLTDGQRATIESLAGAQAQVISLSDELKSCKSSAVKVWKTGHRPILELRTMTGRMIKATGNHPFKTLSGYTRLDELRPGDRIGVMRKFATISTEPSEDYSDRKLALLGHMIGDGSCTPRQPLRYYTPSDEHLRLVCDYASAEFGVEPKVSRHTDCYTVLLSANANKWHPNPMRMWLKRVGLDGKRAHEKTIPECMFGFPLAKIALFLSHLWSTDGCISIKRDKTMGSITYSTTSSVMAGQIQDLLMRFDVLSAVTIVRKGDYRPSYILSISGIADQVRFAEAIGVFGDHRATLEELMGILRSKVANTNRDTIPLSVWQVVKEEMSNRGVTQREMATMRGTSYGGSYATSGFCPSRATLAEYAGLLCSAALQRIAESDIFWDTVRSVEPCGESDVYDMEVWNTHNFVANGMIVHNSIEQDADIVVFLHPEKADYEQDDVPVEFIVAKQRGGPVRKRILTFQRKFTRFLDLGE